MIVVGVVGVVGVVDGVDRVVVVVVDREVVVIVGGEGGMIGALESRVARVVFLQQLIRLIILSFIHHPPITTHLSTNPSITTTHLSTHPTTFFPLSRSGFTL